MKFEIPAQDQQNVNTDLLLDIVAWQYTIAQQLAADIATKKNISTDLAYNDLCKQKEQIRVEISKSIYEHYGVVPKDVKDLLDREQKE